MFVPIARIRVKPNQNIERPSIEKTDRDVSCPVYMVPLFKAKWGPRATIEELPVEEQDKFWQVPNLPGMTPAQSEINRLSKYFGDKGATFNRVYRESDFTDAFNKVAIEKNPLDAIRAKRDEEVRRMATKRSAKALLDASVTAEVNEARRHRETVNA